MYAREMLTRKAVLALLVNGIFATAAFAQQGSDGCDGLNVTKDYGRSSALGAWQCIGCTSDKLAQLRCRRTQLPQHFPYASVGEDSYYFRPYHPVHVERQKSFMGDSKNPYDNRMFESLYRDLDR